NTRRCPGLEARSARASFTESSSRVRQMPSTFHPHAQRNADLRRDACQETKIVRPLESATETQPHVQPALLRLSAIVSQYFTRRLCLFCSPHGNDEIILTVAMRRSTFSIVARVFL